MNNNWSYSGYPNPMRQEPNHMQSGVTGEMDVQKRTSQDIVLHEGVNIKANRVGNTDRTRAIQHIKEMSDKGYIDSEEAVTRINHVTNSETRNEINTLTYDLPAPVDHRSFWQKRNWDDPKYYLPVLLSGMFMSLCSGILPGVILAQLHKFASAEGQAVFVPLLILGVVGFFTSLVITVVKSSE